MAKKRTPGKAKSFSEAIGLQYIFNNTITDFFLGFALVASAVRHHLAMVSFLNTGAADQSCWRTAAGRMDQHRDSSSRTTADPWVPSSPIGSWRSTSVSLPS